MSSRSIGSIVDFFLQPVPFLPDGSILNLLATPAERRQMKIKARAKRQRPKQAIRTTTTTTTKLPPRIVSLTGTIEAGKETAFSINGDDFEVTHETWFFGEPKVGSKVTVQLLRQQGHAVAKKIVVL